MLNRLEQYGTVRSFAETCMDGMSMLAHHGYTAEGSKKGHLLAYYPGAKGNPFQDMLYADGPANGFACFPVSQVDNIAFAPEGLSVVLHLHWVHRIFRGLERTAEAKVAVGKFLYQIEALQTDGHKLVWTVHNKLSHGGLFPDEEYTLRAELAKHVDIIHIMNPDSASLCEPEYTLPADKLMHSPHPSYSGVYSNHIAPGAARFHLGLAPDDVVFLIFGRMLPQKGVRQFLRQLDALQQAFDGRAKLLLIGGESSPEFTEDILAFTAARPDVHEVRSYVEDRNVQVYFQAADVVVCPYLSGLNSGVVMTAATFGKPVVTAQKLQSIFGRASNRMVCFDTAKMEDVVEACRTAVAYSRQPDTAEAITAWADSLAPKQTSARFFSALRERL